MLERPIAFSLTFMVLFALSCAFLAVVDALPEPKKTHASGATASREARPPVVAGLSASPQVLPGLPVRIIAPTIGLDMPVSNPSSTSVEALDQALLSGTVRYPASALLGQEGGVLIVGHSSYLPVVHNQNFKAFNHIKELKEGDDVSVYSAEAEYHYRVVGVRLGKALASTPQDVVKLPDSGNGKYLVMVTCDSFGAKSDRYIVTAEFVGVYAL
ncbi:hypothetical protein A3D70_01075 [Candidatus Adlerbacteria bacterium RIFCSPHIGHO2_02_FULL_54_18]|uniref:Sortase n=1 Tax=Candidatus Adlerbacteria bacterium RIFCSPHIGHO2_02_FULL_54_18 TaxID=1797241 RepID=A0A1F4Y4Q6_9BACT|nr:MAG: hypothetical protein A3D70_01075 [Candidatus Adlerbacteria bacterium RIFCSPHIGHO2_02_FULL_54_18]